MQVTNMYNVTPNKFIISLSRDMLVNVYMYDIHSSRPSYDSIHVKYAAYNVYYP